jgi:hypothetical protein
MKKFLLILVAIGFFSCSKDDCQSDPSKRSGAKCKDGTTTSATGSGACSGHGGVSVWQCK